MIMRFPTAVVEYLQMCACMHSSCHAGFSTALSPSPSLAGGEHDPNPVLPAGDPAHSPEHPARHSQGCLRALLRVCSHLGVWRLLVPGPGTWRNCSRGRVHCCISYLAMLLVVFMNILKMRRWVIDNRW